MKIQHTTNRRSSRLIAWLLVLALLSVFLAPVTLWATPLEPGLSQELQQKQLQSPIVGVYYVPYGGEFTPVFERNTDTIHAPASITKLMTLFTAKRIIDDKMLPLDTVYTVQEEDYAGLAEAGIAVMGLTAGDEVTLQDLLYGTLLASGADAVNALLSALDTDREKFLYYMNEIAKNSGWNMSFTDPVGLYNEKQYMTGEGAARLLFACLVDPLLNQLLHQKFYTTGPTQLYPGGIAMQHSMIAYGTAINLDTTLIQGGKTGWVPESGYNLVSFQDLDTGTLLIVTMGAPNSGDNVVDHLDILTAVNHYVTLPLAHMEDMPKLEADIAQLRQGIIPTETETTTTEATTTPAETTEPTNTIEIVDADDDEETTGTTAGSIISTEAIATTTTVAATTEATTTERDTKTMAAGKTDRTFTWLFFLTLAFLSLIIIILIAEITRYRRGRK